MAVAKHEFSFYVTISVLILWRMFGVIVLLEGPPTAKSQLPGRGNQVFG